MLGFVQQPVAMGVEPGKIAFQRAARRMLDEAHAGGDHAIEARNGEASREPCLDETGLTSETTFR